ncbi:hypothetical protein OEW28_15535 [Defluviimonas sp. WL0002]|uniref:Uncharacterized protein n=1 Tax=Albidovulum marisflavi TaxID=2984159 RepID=A0ABT2ZFW7_9RHOB|nr:hypothetical protein [Defluviimonas sp. WL0002]MCV2870043.1 hypothetical protein [Defluviimonas sp. WL0002]
MKHALVVIASLLPISAEAGNRVFDCSGAVAQATAQLVQYEGEDKGHVLIEGAEIPSSVYPGANSLFFVVIGEGFTQNFTVQTDTGELNYTGTGSKSGFAKGTCAEAQG